MTPVPIEYAAARRALLDAIDVLEPHRASMVRIGAQAVYFHTGESGLRVAPMTTDADLAFDVAVLSDSPEIASVLEHAGFRPKEQPGTWANAGDVGVDLMVAVHQSGRTSAKARAARVPPHAKITFRVCRGLAAALVDNAEFDIAALEDGDLRTHRLRVAGPSALLVAKTIKIRDRMDSGRRHPGRIVDKDALDVLRLLQAVPTETFSSRLLRFEPGSPAEADVGSAIGVLRDHAATAESKIPILARRAANGDPTAAPSLAVLVQQLLAAVDAAGHSV